MLKRNSVENENLKDGVEMMRHDGGDDGFLHCLPHHLIARKIPIAIILLHVRGHVHENESNPYSKIQCDDGGGFLLLVMKRILKPLGETTMKGPIEIDGPSEMMRKLKDDANNVSEDGRKMLVRHRETILNSDVFYLMPQIRYLAFIYQIPLGRRLMKKLIVLAIQMVA